MNYQIAQSFRKFILGDPRQFQNYINVGEHLKHQIHTNDLFQYLVGFIILLFLISLIVLIFSESTITSSWIAGYFFGFVILYSAYCLQISIETRKKLETINDYSFNWEDDNSSMFISKLLGILWSNENKNKLDGSNLKISKSSTTKNINNTPKPKLNPKSNTKNESQAEKINKPKKIKAKKSKLKKLNRKLRKNGSNLLEIQSKTYLSSKKNKKNSILNKKENVNATENKKNNILSLKSSLIDHERLKTQENDIDSNENETKSERKTEMNVKKKTNSDSNQSNDDKKIARENVSNKQSILRNEKSDTLKAKDDETDTNKKKEIAMEQKGEDDKENSNEESIDSEKSLHDSNVIKKQKYIEKIHEIITFKKESDKIFESFINTLKNINNEVFEYHDKFENLFVDFMADGKKIKNELLAIDISLEPYSYEVSQINVELHKKFSILDDSKTTENDSNSGKEEKTSVNNPNKTQEKPSEKINPDFPTNSLDYDDKASVTQLKDGCDLVCHNVNSDRCNLINNNTTESKEKLNYILSGASYLLNNIKSRSRLSFLNLEKSKLKTKRNSQNLIKLAETNSTDIESESFIRNLKILEFTLTIQGILAFTALIFILLGFYDYSFFIKIIVILLLGLCMYYGIIGMLYTQVVDKKCILQNVEECMKKTEIVAQDILEELQSDLNQETKAELASQKENNNESETDILASVESRFSELASHYEKMNKKIASYIVNVTNNRILEKIEVFRDMFKKLQFIKKDFDEIMRHKVNEKDFFKNIEDMKILLEKIKEKVQKIEMNILLKVYNNFAKLNSLFEQEKEGVKDKIQSFVDDDAKERLKRRAELCIKAVKRICNITSKYDQLYFIILFGGSILIIFSFF